MDHERKPVPEYLDLEGVELGFVVNLKTIQEVLKKLSVRGRRWWIATDPADAVDKGFIRVGFGDPHCHDLLNTMYFRLPVVSDSLPPGGTDRIVLILDSQSCIADQPGVRHGTKAGRERNDLLDLVFFLSPIRNALIERMQKDE